MKSVARVRQMRLAQGLPASVEAPAQVAQLSTLLATPRPKSKRRAA